MFDETDPRTESPASGKPEESPSGPARPRRRVLFLDDDVYRAEIFLALCPEAVWVETARACIDRLAESWDEVHLDHDLGGERYVDTTREDCGMEVVRWLCSQPRPHLDDARFFVHSHHLAAASIMVRCLLQANYTAEYRPFGFDVVDLLTFEETPEPQGEPSPVEPRGRLAHWRRRLASFRRLLRRQS